MADKRSAPTLTLNDITPAPAQAEIKEVRLSEEGLREVVLKLGKRTIVVSEADSMADYKLSMAVSKVMAKPLPDKLSNNVVLNLYPPLCACSSGDIPDHEQFLKMGKSAQALWIETARKLNPHEEMEGISWWLFLEELEKGIDEVNDKAKEELLKKKEKS